MGNAHVHNFLRRQKGPLNKGMAAASPMKLLESARLRMGHTPESCSGFKRLARVGKIYKLTADYVKFTVM